MTRWPRVVCVKVTPESAKNSAQNFALRAMMPILNFKVPKVLK